MTVYLDADCSLPQEGVDAINRYGCFALRNAFKREDLASLHDRTLKYFKLAQSEGAEGIARATGLPVDHVAGHVDGACKRGVTHHSLLSWYLYGNPSALESQFARMLAARQVRHFVEPILGSCVLHSNNLAIRYRDVGRSDLALPFHQDSFYFEPELLGPSTVMLVIWTPFTDCDDDTPGLEIVPRRIAESYSLSKEPRTQFKHLEIDVPDQLPVWYPHLQCGDCLVFEERSLHRSRNENVSHPRTSVDLRLFTEGRYPKSFKGHTGIRLRDLATITIEGA
jgi:hypothetical protein